ncbi:hypothetical protein QCA50_014404 [Cerrena zonata]|uniref:G protein-coupled receptor n=1 Tax=Cerrena zonata TaxID=2478898 RepID=A0AAW0FST0_9APHY
MEDNIHPSEFSLPSGVPRRDPTLTLYASYIAVIAMSAWTWDFLLSIPSEVEIFQERLSLSLRASPKLRFSDIVYILARLMTCANMMTAMMLAAEPYNCKVITRLSVVFASLAFPINSLLFFLRVRGVFFESRRLVIAFFALWLLLVGAFVQPLVLVITNMISSKFLCVVNVRPFGTFGFLSVAVFDTLIFLTISLKLTVIMRYMDRGWKARILAILRGGRGLGHASQALLQTGQLYYLASVSVTLACMIIMLAPKVPPVLQGCMIFPGLAIQNMMTCRVFRLLRLGLIEEHLEPISYSAQELNFRTQSPRTLDFARPGETESYSDVVVLTPIRRFDI